MNFESPTASGVSAHSWHETPSAYLLFTPADLVREIYVRYASENRRDVVALFARDIELALTADLPWGGVFHGHDGALRFHRLMTRHIDAAFEPQSFLLAGGDKIAVGGKCRGIARATGRSFAADMIHLWTVTRGKASRCVLLFDVPAIRCTLAQ